MIGNNSDIGTHALLASTCCAGGGALYTTPLQEIEMMCTQLDMTPFRCVVSAIGWLYWLLSCRLQVLAVRRSTSALRKIGMRLRDHAARTRRRACTVTPEQGRDVHVRNGAFACAL